MRILLVRHGRSAHVERRWISRSEVEAWRDLYDAAGLMAGEAPPPALLTRAAVAGLVVSSDLPRAIQSAALLRPDSACERTPLLRETPLPIPNVAARLPLGIWGLLIAVKWLRDPDAGFAETRARAVQAADWLLERAHGHQSIIAVTHGAFRRYLALELKARGWRPEGKQNFAHWSVWELLPP